MSKKFSIIFPTRERIELLTDLLNSIDQTTFDKDNIEVLIAVDTDDFETQNRLLKIINAGYYWIQMHVVHRSLNFSRDYYTHLYTKSTGKWIIVCNDDCQFLTPNWDVIAEETLNQFIGKDPNVVLGWIEDHLGEHRYTHIANYCCFPLLGRDGVDAFHSIFPDRIPTWGADCWAQKLYSNVDKIVKIPMEIKHISHHNKLRPIDAIAERIANNQVVYNLEPTYEEINTLIRACRGK